jgi:hypothetical protein
MKATFAKLRKYALLIILSSIVLAIAIVFSMGKFKLVSTEEFNSSVSSFISIEGADEYVVATLNSGETLTKQKFNKTYFDLPVGDTEASISITATYKYFTRLSGVVHTLVGDTLYIKVPDIELSLPVAFDIRSMSERSDKTGFGPNEDVLKQELRVEMAKQLRLKGESQKASVYEHGAKAIANNFNKYLEANGLSGMYKYIVVQFEGVGRENGVSRKYDYMSDDCRNFSCGLNWNFGDYHIFSPQKYEPK